PDHVIIDKDLTLQAAGTGETLIDGNKVNVPLTIASNTTVVVRNLTLRNGRGGLRNYGATTLIDCTIHENQISGKGGGIWNGGTASLVLQNCTVNSNRCSAAGGGIYNAGVLTMYNTTISGNRATGGGIKNGGGGIDNVNFLTAYNCTITENRASHG